jgi:hypothetical protein
MRDYQLDQQDVALILKALREFLQNDPKAEDRALAQELIAFIEQESR